MRVVILGAGASHHAGYPLAGALGRCLATWIGTLPAENPHRGSLNEIIRAYGTLSEFESIVADLMTCPAGSKAESLGVSRPYVLSGLEEAIREYFDALRSAPAILYNHLASQLRPGDVVITFNYDLGIERALRDAKLWDIRTGYGFAIDNAAEASPVEVLKLHGSTNWRALLFDGKLGFSAGWNSLGSRPVLFFRPDLEYLGYPDFVDPRCTGLAHAASWPAFIMPALPKRFLFSTTFGEEFKSFWDDLWARAEAAIQNADWLAVVGYSLPVIDERARSLLLGAQNKHVHCSVCCGKDSARIEQEFRHHGFSHVESGTPTFEEFLNTNP